jgi:hypothetical protein
MKRLFTFAVAAALTAAFTNIAWSQGGQTGVTGTSRGAGTSGTPGAAGAPGTPSTANAAGRTQLGTQQNRVDGNIRTRSQLGAQTPGFNNANLTPWLNDPGARQQLNLNENQFNQLSRAHQQAYTRYSQGVARLGNKLSEPQRLQQLQQLQTRFNQELGTTLDATITDPHVRQRYSQLNWQFQGPLAFSDPTVQRQLNLTPDQQLQLRQLAADWRRQLGQWRGTAPLDPTLMQQQWNAFRVRYQDQLGAVLTPAQQQIWTQLIGRPYDFPMEAYLRAGADPSSAADMNPIIQNEAV